MWSELKHHTKELHTGTGCEHLALPFPTLMSLQQWRVWGYEFRSRTVITALQDIRLLPDLIVAQPEPVIQEVEADDVIMEGLAFGVPPGGGKGLDEHLLHQLQVRLLIKGCVKAEDWSGALQVVAAQLQLCHGVNCRTRGQGKLHTAHDSTQHKAQWEKLRAESSILHDRHSASARSIWL